MNISNNELIESLIENYKKTETINKNLFKELMNRDIYNEFIEKFPKHISISSNGNIYTMVPGHNEHTKTEDRLKQADFMDKMFTTYYDEDNNKTVDIKDQVKNINSEVEDKIKDKKKGSKNHKKVSATLEILKDKISNFKNSEEFKNLLRTYSKFHNYSANNKQLIYIQTLGQATQVAGYSTWKKLDRNVKKGEKGIKILAPSYYYKKVVQKDKNGNELKDENGKVITKKEKVRYFRPVSVFDVSQTEGKPLPTLNRTIKEDISEIRKPLLKFAEKENIKVFFKSIKDDPILSDDTYGYSAGGVIVINKDNPISNQNATLIHEIAHEKLHRGKDREFISKEQREIEADAVKFIVLDKYGVDSKSEKYLALYQKDYDIMDSLERIADTSKDIINEIEDYKELKIEKSKIEDKLELKGNLKNQLNKIDNSINNISKENNQVSTLLKQKEKITNKIKLLDDNEDIIKKANTLNKEIKKYNKIEKKYLHPKSVQLSR